MTGFSIMTTSDTISSQVHPIVVCRFSSISSSNISLFPYGKKEYECFVVFYSNFLVLPSEASRVCTSRLTAPFHDVIIYDWNFDFFLAQDFGMFSN